MNHGYDYVEEYTKQDDTIYLTMFGNKTDAVNTQAIEEILHDFMNEHPNINISYESAKGDEYFQLLEKRLDTGHGDDIFIVNHDTAIEFAQKGYLHDLSDIAKKIKFHPIIESQLYEDDDKVYFMPTSISSFGLYCNMDLLNTYHIEVPTDQASFLSALEKLKKKGITPLCVNNDISLKTIALGISLYPIYQQEDSNKLLQTLNQDPAQMKEQMRSGFAFVEELIQKGYVDVSLALQTEKTKDDLEQFAQGSYPFMITGTWADSRLQLLQPDFTYEIHAYPILKNKSMLVVNADSRMAINANSPHIEQVEEFLSYFMEKSELQKFVDVQDSHSPLAESQNYKNKAIQLLQKYIDKGDYVIGSDESFQFPIWQISKKGITMLLQGVGLEETLDAMEQEHQSFMKEGFE